MSNYFPGRISNRKAGQAIIIVLMIGLILGILSGAVFNFQRGQVNLLSKGAKETLSLYAAEAGLNCVLAEMKADPQFVTHGNAYIPSSGWSSPAKHRPFLVGAVSGLELDHAQHGVYTGRITLEKTRIVAEFRVRVKLLGAKNSLSTKTVEESHRYFQLEAFGRVEDSCRKITAVLEKYLPGAYQFYDGQVLDTGGQGPYRITPGVVRRGRLYGQDMIMFSKRGSSDTGTDFKDMEKIMTPGYLETTFDAAINFRNGVDGKITQKSDSRFPDQFKTFPEMSGIATIGMFVLDGAHGGKSEKFPPLNAKYYKDATDPRPVMLTSAGGCEGFGVSKWRNPTRPEEVVYDLDFGWKYKNSDDKKLYYSTVPLRIWGCPPSKAATIFCEKDVYIAGDFNANPDSPQNYDLNWKEYSERPKNGTDKNGAAIISLGRIWFDYSQPILFLRNEMTTLLDYEIAMRLGGRDMNELSLAPFVFPHRATADSDPRLPLSGLAVPPMPKFSVVEFLIGLPKEPPQMLPISTITAFQTPKLDDLRAFFDPSSNPAEYKTRFCLKEGLKNDDFRKIVTAAFTLPIGVTKGVRDNVIESVLDQALKDSQLETSTGLPDPTLGPWNVADRLFMLAVKYPKLGFRMPEMTVNALLIDSAKLNARWDAADGATKVENEIGNISSKDAMCVPFISDNSRMILRHYGGMMHLRTLPAAGKCLDGSARSDNFLVRRNAWDDGFVEGGGDYYPRYLPAAFGMVGWHDEMVTSVEFEAVK
ncbi:MAG: hypothetical protein HQM09_00085 [Candidatus Riflebacteria bacterium]|nr:hypothetical protein [Candidatus Riflebacteria bacterium]